MSFTMDIPEDLGGSNDYMNEPGQFHFLVVDVRDGKKFNGDIMAGFSVELEAITGTEKGKKTNINLSNGELKDKDHGEFRRKKQAAFLIATNVITPAQLGKQGVSVELESAIGAQLCVDLVLGEPSDKPGKSFGKRFLDVNGASMYHVDDPRAAKIVKDTEALSFIPANFRQKPEFFESIVQLKKQNGTSGSKPATSDADFEGL